MEPTYILTAELDADSFAWLDSLRRNHFSPERNLLPAHLTLFHRLSSAQMASLSEFVTPLLAVPCSSIAPCFWKMASPYVFNLPHWRGCGPRLVHSWAVSFRDRTANLGGLMSPFRTRCRPTQHARC